MPFPDFSEESKLDDSNQDLSASEFITPENRERYEKAKQSARRLYLILLAIGLVLGILAAIGVVSFLRQFGLTGVPVQVESTE
ncbi:MAG: hypothetical protein AAFQ57_09185 [Cyanobacteria bacterium J06626_14]